MIFQTPTFLLFFVVVAAVVATLRDGGARKTFLLSASWVFYAWPHGSLLVLLLGSTAVTFAVGSRLASETRPRRRRAWLGLSLGFNLSLLAWFKYVGFLSENTIHALRALGLGAGLEPLRAALPVGISFYTLQAVGYSIDVYRRRDRAASSFRDFALYLAFFPRLTAGPIVRTPAFLRQLAERAEPALDAETVLLFLGGLVKKVVLADNLAPFVAAVYDDVERWPSAIVLLATVAFTVQAYCDFSGYTDMAMAVARVLGYRLPPNFDFPFFARNPSEFWRRWHVSLSSWIRDYVFGSLPGSRDSAASRWRNLVITMVAAGLWHGAAWTFVVFGFVHGVLLAAHDGYGVLRRRFDPSYLPATGPLARWTSIFAMQCTLLATMILFRAPDLASAGTALSKLFFFDLHAPLLHIGLGEIQATRAVILVAVFALLHAMAKRFGPFEEHLARAPALLAAAACLAIGFGIYCLWPMDEPPFIYFRF